MLRDAELHVLTALGDGRGETLARVRALIRPALDDAAFMALIRAAVALNAAERACA